MHSIVLFGILTVVTFSGHLPRSNAVPAARLQELLNLPDIDQNRQQDHLQSLLEPQAQEYPQKLCQPDKPASPWCEYLQTLKRHSKSEPDIKLNEKRESDPCWPGIPRCRKHQELKSRQTIPAVQNSRRSIRSAAKCRAGMPICRKGKRTARSPQCLPGFPWCG